MRKSLILTLLLTSAASLEAKEISPHQALSVAREVLGSVGPQKVVRSVASPASANDAPQPYYVFNSADDHGFAIISGDDRAPRVLGYSDSGSVDAANLPPQLKALLDGFGGAVATLPDVRHKSWNATSVLSDSDGVLIPTANWGQGYPYNTECPEKEGEPTLTGCVATAMAIVMKHHSWPESYDWDAMPMNTESDSLDFDGEVPELARLMHEAGEAVFMEYSSVESGAYLDWIGHRMQYVFNYSPECQYLGWENFDSDNWVSMLKDNLDKGNPVIYDGFGTGGHHAFVLDGYDGDMYHVNWGWNGMANGYYALMDLTPFEGENFSDHQGMVINIEPDRSLGDYSECFVDYGYLWASGTNRMAAEMNVSVENIETGKPFHLINSLLTVPAGFEGLIGVAIVDKDGNVKEVLRTQHVSTFQSWTNSYETTNSAIRYYNLIPSCEIKSTDRLQLVSKQDKDQNYKLILGTMEWPSSRPVNGNRPMKAKVVFNIGEGVHCSYYLEGSDEPSVELSPGQTTVESYIGEFYSLFYGKTDIDAADPLQMTLHGKFFGGDSESWTGHQPMGYPFGIYAEENVVDIKLIHLEDETIHLDEAGTLSDKLDEATVMNLGELTISGKMNATDFWFIRDNCRNLTSLDLGAVTIEEFTGGDGGWVPDGMTHPANAIPYMAIPSLTNLERLILPENLESIEGFSLQGLKLTSVTIPVGVKSIGQDAFFGNYDLEAVEILNPEVVEVSYPPFDDTKCPENGVLFVPEGTSAAYADANVWKDFGRIIEGPMPNPLKFTTILDNVAYECYIDEATVTGWEGEPVNLVIPESFEVDGRNYTVTAIANDAFNQCLSLESVEMPNTITSIGYNAFLWCVNLRDVRLSDKVEEIQYGTFQGCSSLEEFIITPSIRYIGTQALYGAGIKSLYIPKTLNVKSPNSAFGYNLNLEEFVVEEGSPVFTAIDGLLYRRTERGLALEAVPGKRSGFLEIPAECHDVMADAFTGADIAMLAFNEGLESLSSRSIFGLNSLIHLTLPKSVKIQNDAISDCMALESVAFHGTPEAYANIFSNCPNIRHIYINSDGEQTVCLDGLFGEEYDNLNLYTSKLDKDYGYMGDHTLFVPGQNGDASDKYGKDDGNVEEMYIYCINREHNIVVIHPRIEGISIDRVIINGRVANPTVDGGYTVYLIDEERQPSETRAGNADISAGEDLDVRVDYTIHGRQKMTTNYPAEFNASLPDNFPTGLETIKGDTSQEIRVYTLDGILLFKGLPKNAGESLSPGVYLIQRGASMEKVIIGR